MPDNNDAVEENDLQKVHSMTTRQMNDKNAGKRQPQNNKDDVKGTPRASGEPPDGGWGWIVVMASFGISLLVDGVCFSFGIFFDEFRNEFGTSKATTSWIGSVLNGSYLSLGPIVSAVVNIYGCRKVAVGGAVLAFSAFFLSTFSPNIGVLIFTYGFLGGTGFGLMYLPAIVMVGYYFERRRALATGLACCGSGIGAFLFAPFTEHLLKQYGWRGANWILAALVLHSLAFALFYRPLSPARPAVRVRQLDTGQSGDEEAEMLVTSAFEDAWTTDMKNITPPSAVDREKPQSPVISDDLKAQIFEGLRSENVPDPVSKTRTRTMSMHTPQSSPPDQNYSDGASKTARLAFSQDFNLQHRKRPKEAGSIFPAHNANTPPLQRKDIFYSGSLWQLKEFQEADSAKEYRKRVSVSKAAGENVARPGTTSFVQSFVSVFDVSLLRSPTFLIYGSSCFLCMAGFFVPFVYLPTHALDMGMGTTKAAFLISIIGIANTVARVLVGFVSDQPWADCLLINNVALIVGGLATLLVPYYLHYYLLGIYAAVFGTAIAIFVSLRSIIMVELMGLDKLTTAFGFVIMCQGFSSFLGPPLAGTISDLTGNYDAAFYMAGIALTLSGVICLPLRRVARWENNRGDNSRV